MLLILFYLISSYAPKEKVKREISIRKKLKEKQVGKAFILAYLYLYNFCSLYTQHTSIKILELSFQNWAFKHPNLKFKFYGGNERTLAKRERKNISQKWPTDGEQAFMKDNIPIIFGYSLVVLCMPLQFPLLLSFSLFYHFVQQSVSIFFFFFFFTVLFNIQ